MSELHEEKPQESLVNTDYALLMKDVLLRLQDSVRGDSNATNLVNTALDYLFYLEDNRRVIL